MAGRGTDIKLDPAVRRAGGLHVILTELHESERIDWQLIGRGARQGDPGTYRIHVSIEDDILDVAFAPAKANRIRARLVRHKILPSRLIQLFQRAQRRVERKRTVKCMLTGMGYSRF